MLNWLASGIVNWFKGHVNECRIALVKNPFYESFDIIFMGNEKSYQNINCFFFFFHKNFL